MPILKTRVFKSPEELGNQFANEILEEYNKKGKLVLGIPWGSTPIPFFDSFSAMVRKRKIDLSGMHLIMMDEYVVQDNDSYSFVDYDATFCGHFILEKDLLQKLPISEAKKINIHFPDPKNPEGFEKLIQKLGGIDVFLIATGADDGHVAMCGPGTPLGSRTRIVELSETVREYNFEKYKDSFANKRENVPRYGISIGLSTILDARKLLFVAHGSGKAKIVEILIQARRFDENYPITFLWTTIEKTVVYVDKTAAENIRHMLNK